MDVVLHAHLVNLANAIREVPPGDIHQGLFHKFVALIQHLESKDLIPKGEWRLASFNG
jgi:hypothetical protein